MDLQASSKGLLHCCVLIDSEASKYDCQISHITLGYAPQITSHFVIHEYMRIRWTRNRLNSNYPLVLLPTSASSS